jgi:hypothetical protein
MSMKGQRKTRGRREHGIFGALAEGGGGDFLKELAEAVLDRLMPLDFEGLIGAGRCERSDGRTTHRNAYRA